MGGAFETLSGGAHGRDWVALNGRDSTINAAIEDRDPVCAKLILSYSIGPVPKEPIDLSVSVTSFADLSDEELDAKICKLQKLTDNSK